MNFYIVIPLMTKRFVYTPVQISTMKQIVFLMFSVYHLHVFKLAFKLFQRKEFNSTFQELHVISAVFLAPRNSTDNFSINNYVDSFSPSFNMNSYQVIQC